MLTVENAAAEAARFIERVPPYPGNYAGRGIVTCAGGVKYLTCAWVLIKMLRQLGCTLPIEVWFLGEDEATTAPESVNRPSAFAAKLQTAAEPAASPKKRRRDSC